MIFGVFHDFLNFFMIFQKKIDFPLYRKSTPPNESHPQMNLLKKI